MGYDIYLTLNKRVKPAEVVVDRVFGKYDKLIEKSGVSLPDSSIFDIMVHPVTKKNAEEFRGRHPKAKFTPDPKAHSILKIDLTTGDDSPLSPNILLSLNDAIEILWVENEDAELLSFTNLVKLFSVGEDCDEIVEKFAGKKLDEVKVSDLKKIFPPETRFVRCVEDLLMSRNPDDAKEAYVKLNSGIQPVSDVIETLIGALDSTPLLSKASYAEIYRDPEAAEFRKREHLENRIAVLEAILAIANFGKTGFDNENARAEFEGEGHLRLSKYFKDKTSTISKEQAVIDNIVKILRSCS